MRSNSTGLEICIEITEKELEETKLGKILLGNLNFKDKDEDNHKNISFALSYFPNENPEIDISQYPNDVYLGNANRLSFRIQNPQYKTLRQEKYTGNRFGIGGRIEIFVK